MAQRKDQMRIIRQDAGFSAKLGFGVPIVASRQTDEGLVLSGADSDAALGIKLGQKDTKPPLPIEPVNIASPNFDGALLTRLADKAEQQTREEGGIASLTSQASERQHALAVPSPAATRGHIVYVAVSLTARQAALAEIWAKAARCSVQFLIRRVAQGLRDATFSDWGRDGMPAVNEPRGARGKYPTSVTLTLHPDFAKALAATHDPLGVMGLARVMGPAYRARFQAAFDEALVKAKIAAPAEGDDR